MRSARPNDFESVISEFFDCASRVGASFRVLC